MALDSTVKVKFLGDAANLAREAAKASKAADAVGKSAQNTHKHLSNMAKGIIAGAGVGALAVGVERFAKSSVNSFKTAAAEASRLGRLTGLAAEDASRLGFAAKMSGQDADDFARAMGLLSKNLNNADKAQTVLTKSHHLAIKQVPQLVDGHIKYVARLVQVADTQKKTVAGTQSLGFALRDASGHLKPLNELLPQIADKFKQMPDGPEKTALALKLFGRGGAALLPFLNKGAEGIAKLNAEADRLGITMSGKDITAYKQYIVAQRELKAAMQGIKITLGRELFPLFTAWTRSLAENAPQINAAAREYVGKLVPAIQRLTGWIDKMRDGFRDGTGAGGDLREALRTTADVAQGFGDVLIPIVQFFVDHPQVFYVVAGGVVALKIAMAAAAVRASALGVALFGVAGGQAAVAGSSAAAAGGIAAVGTAAAAALGPIAAAAAALGALYAAFLAYKELAARDAFNVDSPDYYVNDPTLSPGTSTGGMRNADGTYTPDMLPTPLGQPYRKQAPRTLDPNEHGAPSPKRNQQSAHDVAMREAAETKAAAAKVGDANQAALDEQLKQAAAAQKAADAKQAAAEALQKATDAMRKALTDRLETARNIRDSLISSNSVVREGLSWTAKDLLARFRTQMTKVRRFSAALQEMVRKGYSQAIVQQVAQAGVQGGMGTAVGLAHASQSQVREFNAVQGGIERAAGYAGRSVASQMGPIQITTKVMLNDRELARAVNTWNAENGPNGHRLAS